ncbi:MAG: type II secretion protein F [Planctomycetota bacterium]|nr:MAG: type II secretion protein F [Planctomycetota bacterium]
MSAQETMAPRAAPAAGSTASSAIRLNPKQIAFFNRQLASMARLNMPIARGLKVLAQEVDEPQFRAVIESVQRDLEQGRTLQQALARFPRSFNPLYIEMLRAGEATGNLAVVLDELAAYTDLLSRVGTRLRDAVLYPLVIIGLTIGFLLLFFWFLVPQFANFYAAAGLVQVNAAGDILDMSPQLSGNMRRMFQVSGFLTNPLVLLFGGVFGLVGVGWGWWRLRRALEQYDDFLFRLPLFGPLIRMATLLKVTRTMRNLLLHGVSMVHSLRIAAGIAGNNRVRDALERICGAVEEGGAFSRALKNDVFPDTVIWKLQMGEEKGVLEEALEEVAKELEGDIDTATTYVTSVVSPLLLAGVSILLMLLMLTVYPDLIRTATLLGT